VWGFKALKQNSAKPSDLMDQLGWTILSVHGP